MTITETGRLLPMTRRGFLTTAGIGLAAAGLGPAISAPFVSRAYAETKMLTIVQWSHFVPAFDTWFDKFAQDWGRKNGINLRLTTFRNKTSPHVRLRRWRQGPVTICSCGTAPADPISTANT